MHESAKPPQPTCVLDASALLAYLHGEPGEDRVAEAIIHCAAIGWVNWAEVLTKQAEKGLDPYSEAARLAQSGPLGDGLVIQMPDDGLACEVARLRPVTRGMGLSLGDRACLALGISRRLPVLTTERLWEQLPPLGVKIVVIR
ncbi:MAG: type II toxin-antitoxin system VapC family toxin [Armatimonadetes bacterium]|nr:type II toxin-antitoxin system VapC family toxin [Armatimonadota bacterium]